MLIRPLVAADATTFKKFRLAAVAESPASFLPTADEVASTSLAQSVEKIEGVFDSVICGAFADDALVAMVGLRQETLTKRRHIASVWGVHTIPGFRRQGLARALLEQVMTRAGESASIRVLVLHVDPENRSAKALYQSLGFATTGRQPMSLLVDGTFHDEESMALVLPEKSAAPD